MLGIEKAFIQANLETGLPLDSNTIEDLIRLNTFEDDTQIWESQVVNFVSEYRVLVHQGLVFACRHYKGDCSVFPNMDVATQATQRFTQAPVGYSLDLGVTDDGQTPSSKSMTPGR
jgi:hypothetical protein